MSAGSASQTQRAGQAKQNILPTSMTAGQQQAAPSGAILSSALASSQSSVFQQVKQTQASLARLTRAQQQQQTLSQTNQSSHLIGKQQASNANAESSQHQQPQQQPHQQQQLVVKSNTFVDCLIRRFKDCFSEDFCTVPMFVVGNLSPGSDGTHLILPPCVSLGRQNINRFASPKNLRLMNSIRESCRSIEELDLGGNKLNDLIEVYKILQCTPNLKFLNLSENDLSRSSPVAMAASCSNAASSNSYSGYQSNTISSYSSTSHHHHPAPTLAGGSNSCHHSPQQQHNWSTSSMTINQRTCLAPINQNHQQQHSNSLGNRRHSTLERPTNVQGRTAIESSNRSQLSSASQRGSTVSRVAEARRLAAANAVAQSKKTSSSIANKLTNSAASVNSATRKSGTMVKVGNSSSFTGSTRAIDKLNRPLGCQRHSTASASTMHLARSLSSLSAKDIRACSNTSINRISSLAAERSQKKTESGIIRSSGSVHNQQQAQQHQAASVLAPKGTSGNSRCSSDLVSSASGRSLPALVLAKNLKLVTQKLFVEPIVESDNDIDMSEQQISPTGASSTTASSQVSSNDKQLSHHQASSTRNIMSQSGSAGTNSTRFNSNSSSSGGNFFRRTFESIKALALNNTGCQWRVVCSILSRMPNLEELHLSLNNYERIDFDPIEFKHFSLKRLYLCNNPKLTNWQELDKLLIAFPSLEALSIADCNISQIPDNLDRAREWRKLLGLNINGWPIKEWPIIERLNQLPSLIDLKCRNLEILNTIDEPRHHLIARLPKLQKLNGSEIEEREDAEKAFLRFFMANSHLERPSRFHELVQIHGEVATVDVDVDLSPPSHAQVRVIYLNRNYYIKGNEDDIMMSEDFLTKLMNNVDPVSSNSNATQQLNSLDNMDTNNDSESDNSNKCVRLFKDEGQEVLAIEIDLRQSVRKFKSTLSQLFGLSNQGLILYYIDREMVGLMGPELIKHNQKKLWNYNVRDGDQFIVEER